MKKVLSFVWLVRAMCRKVVMDETQRLYGEFTRNYPYILPRLTSSPVYARFMAERRDWVNAQLIIAIPQSIREMAV